MAGATIELQFASPDAEDAFCRDYLPEAWDRFRAADAWDHGWFWRYGMTAGTEAGPDGGLVRLVFDGDPEGLVAAERDRWEGFEGLEDWTVTRYDDPDAAEEAYDSLLAQQRDAKGAVGGEREYRFKALTAELAVEYYREFDEPLPATPEPDGDGDPIGIGVWTLLHDLLVQMGFAWYDETDAALRMCRNRLKSIAAYHGAGAAREEYERIREEWAAFEETFETWLADNPTGHRSEP